MPFSLSVLGKPPRLTFIVTLDLSEIYCLGSLPFLQTTINPIASQTLPNLQFLSFINHTHASPSQDTETGSTVALGLQSICDNLLHHVMSLIRQEVVGKLSLVGVTTLIPRGVPDSSIDLDARNTQRGLVGRKVADRNVKHAKGGAILLDKCQKLCYVRRAAQKRKRSRKKG